MNPQDAVLAGRYAKALFEASKTAKAARPLVDRLKALLSARKRLFLLPAVAGLFQALADEAEGLVRVQARSARPLTDAQAKALSASVEKALKSRVALEHSVDETLLGGVVVRAGDRSWDLSLKGRLARLKEKLLETSIN